MHAILAGFTIDMSFKKKIFWIPVRMAFIAPIIFELYLGQLIDIHRHNRRDTPWNGFHIWVRLSGFRSFIRHD